MAIVGTKFIWDDESDITAITAPTEDTIDRPVFMCVFSADKGPEEFQKKLMGTKFFDLYGTSPSFSKHGQTLLQAANVINAGGRLFCKRIVADDATLANIGICAKVTKTQVQKTDSNGNPIYTDGTNETTVATGNTPVMIQKVTIKFVAKSVDIKGNNITAMAKSFLTSNAHTNEVGTDGEYPLFLITDNGRGKSSKKFRIYADTSSSRPVSYIKYVFKVLEDNTELESFAFTLNPDIIEKSSNMSLQNIITTSSNQIRCRIFEDEIKAFMENVSYLTDIEGYKNTDIFFGNDFYGKSYENIIIDSTGLPLDTAAGINLINPDDGRGNGGNGEFGEYPVKADSYVSELEKAFNGSDSDEIYDLDNSRIDVIFDANFPASVKRAIEALVTFREDCMFFRDIGIGQDSIEEIDNADETNLKNRFCSTYSNSWDVIDPYTRKQITVTATYSLATLFVAHFLNGVARPFAGQLYGVTFNDVINGTINFTPKNTPSVDQRQYFDDARINYAKYYDGTLVMESEYTSQEKLTQLSWLHNVLAVQSLIREIRAKCPKNRYQFLDGNDMVRYKADVNDIIKNHSSEYKSIEMNYVQDSTYESNKIFYAVIYVTFRNFVQSEIFKIIALKS